MLHLTGPGETQTVVRPGLAEPRAFERRGLAGPLSSLELYTLQGGEGH